VTPLTTILLLLIGVLIVAVAMIAQCKRTQRPARCPHCCVRKHYYVGYAHTERIDTPAPVRCKSCQLLFMMPK